MRKFYGFFDNRKYKVGCNGGTIYVYDQNETELTRFKGLSCTYRGAFRPGTNRFIAKSTYDYSFTARFVGGEVKDLRPIQSNAYPITDWSAWDKNDCRYLDIYKNWETEGFSELSAQKYECLKDNPPKVTIKHIWELNG